MQLVDDSDDLGFILFLFYTLLYDTIFNTKVSNVGSFVFGVPMT